MDDFFVRRVRPVVRSALRERPIGGLFRRAARAIDRLGYAYLPEDLLRFVGRDAQLIIDVGAHRGESAALFASLFPSATIICLEPAPDAFAHLIEARILRVRAHNVAAGSAAGSEILHVNADPKTTSLLPSSEEGNRVMGWRLAEATSVPVPVVRLDDLAAAEGVEIVDLLKIDVQGRELDVLEGAAELLSRVRAVQVEATFLPQYQGSCRFSDIEQMLARHGFGLYNLYALFREPEYGRLVFGDALFVRTPAAPQI